MPELESTNLASVTYDEETQELTITFRSGSTYVYSAVPLWVYNGLVTTIDPGGYFNQVIKGSFAYELA
jgi:hypothetical protein